MSHSAVLKIVSGGQSGVDRAALDFAIEHGLSYGGWCPKGRRAEDGTIPARYRLQETPHADYKERTEWNVRDSDATLIFSDIEKLTGGTKFTLSCAKKHRKPFLILTPTTLHPENDLKNFLKVHLIQILNIAGPRATRSRHLAEFVCQVLTSLL